MSPQNDYPVWQDTVTVSTNPVRLTSMRFTNLGSIDTQYLINLRLYVDGVQVGAAVPSMCERTNGHLRPLGCSGAALDLKPHDQGSR